MILYADRANHVIHEVKKAVIGKDECVLKVMAAILAGGHILLDDVPGVGKTTMAMAFSRAMELKQNRVQFTPDVLPSDITGFSLYQKETGRFVYQPGAVLCNLFLADEINRTSPKTQSALLQVMEEGKITVDSVTREVPQPFIVMATQNPIGSYGTQMLPESQLDRFMICLTMGYPDIRGEIAIIKNSSSGNQWDTVTPVISAEELLAMQKEQPNVFIQDVVYAYIAALISATREHPMLQMGVSPRGTIALTRMARASAYLRNRDFVIPEDVLFVARDVMLHRIHLNSKARVSHVTAEDVLDGIIEEVKKPSPRSR